MTESQDSDRKSDLHLKAKGLSLAAGGGGPGIKPHIRRRDPGRGMASAPSTSCGAVGGPGQAALGTRGGRGWAHTSDTHPPISGAGRNWVVQNFTLCFHWKATLENVKIVLIGKIIDVRNTAEGGTL